MLAAFWQRISIRAFILAIFAIVCVSSPVTRAHADSATYYYDPAGRLTGVVDPVNGSAQYTYDANGNILSVTRIAVGALFVAEVSPSSGVIGATATINGVGFGTTANTTVSFNGIAAAPTAVTSTSITVKVPTGATSGPVKVTTPAGTASSAVSFAVSGAAPKITAIPTGITAQGATIVVTGTGFDPMPSNDAVQINGLYAKVTSATATSLSVVVPAIIANSPVVVTTANGTATSAANLVVPPYGATAAGIQSVTASALGSSPAVTFDGTNRAQMITFGAKAGQDLAFVVTSAAGAAAGSLVTLVSPDGTQVGNNWIIATGAVSGDLPTTRTGTYALWLVPTPGTTGGVTISLNLVPAPVAATITPNATPVNVTAATAGQGMSVTFNGTAGQRIALNVAVVTGYGGGNQGDLVRIIGPMGQLFSQGMWYASNPRGFFTGLLVLPPGGTGTYTISFTSNYGETGTLAFTMYSVPPSASAALVANVGATILTTTVPGQGFSATFNGTAGQTISFDLIVVPPVGPNDLGGNGAIASADQITITGPTGQIYYGTMWSSILKQTELFTGALTLPAGGTGVYTITDVPNYMETGTLSFALYSFAPQVSGPLTVNDVTTNLTIATPGQIFAPTFTETAGQRFSLDMKILSGNLASSAGGSDQIAITGPTGQIFSALMGYYSNNPELFSGALTVPAGGTGTYTVTDVPWSGQAETGSIAFTLQNVPPDPTSGIVMSGAAVALTTTAAGQSYILTFSGTAGQTVAMMAQGTTGTVVNTSGVLTVVEPDGTTQVYSGGWCACASPWYTSNFTLPVTGTYTAKFTSQGTSTGGVSFNLYNETTVGASIVPGGGSVTLTTTSPGQPFSITFPETVGHRVSVFTQFDATLSTTQDNLAVIAPDGTTQVYNQTAGFVPSYLFGPIPFLNSAAGDQFLPQSGTYTIYLQPGGELFGKTIFTVYDVPPDVVGNVTVGAAPSSFVITTPGQALRASVSGQTGQTMTFNVVEQNTTPAVTCFNYALMEPDGQTTLIAGQSCSGSYSYGATSLPETGVYVMVALPVVSTTGTFTVGATSP